MRHWVYQIINGAAPFFTQWASVFGDGQLIIVCAYSVALGQRSCGAGEKKEKGNDCSVHGSSWVPAYRAA